MRWVGMCVWALLFVINQASAYDSYNVLQGMDHLSARENLAITAHLHQNLGADVQIRTVRRVDLNRDGVDEFFVKTSQCRDDVPEVCTVLIFGEYRDQFITLGEMDARALTLAHEYTNGVQALHVFRNPGNDFDYERYVWAADRSRYILEK